MKKSKRKKQYNENFYVHFMRGAIASGLVASAADCNALKTAKISLQGGISLAVAISAAESISRGRIGHSMFLLSSGFYSLKTLENLFPENLDNITHKEIQKWVKRKNIKR